MRSTRAVTRSFRGCMLSFIEAETVKVEKDKEDTEKLAADAKAELKKAEPALLAA